MCCASAFTRRGWRRIANFAEWRAHLLARLRHQLEITADPQLIDLLSELSNYPPPPGMSLRAGEGADPAAIDVPFRLATDRGVLSLFSTTTVFGRPVEITLAELAIEAFSPPIPPRRRCCASSPRRKRDSAVITMAIALDR